MDGYSIPQFFRFRAFDGKSINLISKSDLFDK